MVRGEAGEVRAVRAPWTMAMTAPATERLAELIFQ